MRYNFCTYFDSHFIHKGLALYESLTNVCDDFYLFIMALDDDSYNLLQSLNLKNIVVENIKIIESPELLHAKATRTRAEYCWTCGPSVIYYFLTKYELNDISYLDSDLMFFSSPKAIYDEIGNGSVAITEHFTPTAPLEGKYCVQYLFFRNDTDGIKVLKWWRDKCIEWCYCRFDGDRYADQKYLERFASLTNKLIVLKNRGAGVAIWNANLYRYQDDNIIYNNETYPIVFFHFHGLKFDCSENHLDVYSSGGIIVKKSMYLYIKHTKLMVTVYNKYLNKTIDSYTIHELSFWKKIFIKIRSFFSKSHFLKLLYYKTAKRRFNGFENKKI